MMIAGLDAALLRQPAFLDRVTSARNLRVPKDSAFSSSLP
jgi:hypothetical protein